MDVSTQMNVTQTPSSTATTNGGAQKPQTVDYEAFLKLLVTKMKNQDPTSPMESRDFVAQLASFSQVEQSVQINDKLDQILQASSLAQAGGLIGREVTSPDGEVTGTVAEVRVVSDGVTAVLESGEEVTVGPGITVR